MSITVRVVLYALIYLLSGPALVADEATPAGGCDIPKNIINTRPHADGDPVEVHIGIFLIDLIEIQDSSQTFTADIHVSLRWIDPRLSKAALGYSLAGCRLPLDQIWHPGLDIVNRRTINPLYPRVVTVDGTGLVHYRQRLYGELSSRLDLREFPFDEQTLPIHCFSTTYGPDEVVLRLDERRTGMLESLSIADWSVELGEAVIDTQTVTTIGGENRALPQLVYSLLARRDAGYYIWKVFFPLTLIVFMAWTVFWIDPAHLAPQIGVATSSVLTLIAFQLSLGYLLPRISYLTRADRFILGSAILVFLALGEAILTAALAKGGREKLSRSIDRWSRLVYLLLFLILIKVEVM